MKVLHCPDCDDVRRIYGLVQYPGQTTVCGCGKVKARYITSTTVLWNGNGFVIGFDAPKLKAALDKALKVPDSSVGIPVTGMKVLPRNWKYLKIDKNMT